MRATRMLIEVEKFAEIMAAAEEQRAILKRNFGLTDAQIGSLALAARTPYRGFVAATVAAMKRRGETHE